MVHPSSDPPPHPLLPILHLRVSGSGQDLVWVVAWSALEVAYSNAGVETVELASLAEATGPIQPAPYSFEAYFLDSTYLS